MSAHLRQIIDFIIEVDKLKAVLRKTKPVGLERYENSAEHCWQISLLALLLAPHARFPVDTLRVVEILLVHDIPEIDSGDQIVYQGSSEARAAAEFQAARRLFGLLPATQAEWCMARWEEYEARVSHEAVFAYAVDRLMPVLQNLKNSGQSWRENQVPLEQVLAVNAAIGEAMPVVWEQVQVLIAEFAVADRIENPEKRTSASLSHAPAHSAFMKRIVWSQFGAAIDMLENAMRAAPESVWGSRSRQPEFWYVAYHTLFFLDYYLSASPEGFAPPAPYTLSELDPEGVLPDRIYSKDELLAYLAHGREKCRAALAALTDEQAGRPAPSRAARCR